MYEDITYEGLLSSMLTAALADQPGLDAREGSVLWYGQAPAAAEAQNLYIQLDAVLNETFADTASRPYLLRRAAERGLSPKPASCALIRGEFLPQTLEISVGTRFNLGEINYAVEEKLEPGSYSLRCETAGTAGNDVPGDLTPVEYVPGLQSASAKELLIPGTDEEETEAFRARYLASFVSQSFGGNAADYREKVGAIAGVGGVKVYRAWNGPLSPNDLRPPEEWEDWFAALPEETPESVAQWLDAVSRAASEGLLTTGGVVRLTILDSTFSPPSAELVEQVQQAVDPKGEAGEGEGFAPIGHVVLVEGVTGREVEISASFVYEDSWDWEACRPYLEQAARDYLLSLRKAWADSPKGLTVRISALESAFLACPGILDVTGTTLCGEAANLELTEDEVPVEGALHGS